MMKVLQKKLIDAEKLPCESCGHVYGDPIKALQLPVVVYKEEETTSPSD